MAGNTLWGWGANEKGQLGDGSTVDKSSPVQIGTLSTWSVTAQGAKHTLSIKTDSTLWAWGMNSKGQLGDGTTVDKSSPVQVGTLATWAKIAGTNGGDSGASFAIKTDSTMWAWGYNGAGIGVLGLNDVTNRSSPVQVGTLANWAEVAGRDFGASARKTDSTLWGWGYNDLGQIGDGASPTPKSSPVQVGTLATWANLGTTGNASSAIKTDGTLWEWGRGAGNAQGNTTNHNSPVQVGTMANWALLPHGNASNEGTVAIKTDSTMWSWGIGTGGILGTNSTANVNSPVQIGTLAEWRIQSTGNQFANAVKTDSTLWAWGLGTSGRLGDNTAASKSSPVQVGTLASWFTVSSSGVAHAVALQSTAVPPSGPTNLKTYNTNVKANIKTINTNVIANVKSLDTNT